MRDSLKAAFQLGKKRRKNLKLRKLYFKDFYSFLVEIIEKIIIRAKSNELHEEDKDKMGGNIENKIIQVIQNSKVTHPLAVAGQEGNRYWIDFYNLTEDYRKVLSEKQYDDFLAKSRLDSLTSMPEYLQFATEATVVDYIIRNHEKEFENEPQYNNKKNPECSFRYVDRIVNVEVKCPDFTKRIEQEESKNIKIFSAERMPTKEVYKQVLNDINSNLADETDIQEIDRMDNKLKDYLLSAHAKFPESGDCFFNVLVIALDIVQDMDEWYSYIFGDTGVFTDKSFIKEKYSNVDAILLTNVQYGHRSDKIDLSINCWHLENYLSLLFLNPIKQNDKKLWDYYANHAIYLFSNHTFDFLLYQQYLDKENEKRDEIIRKQTFIEKYSLKSSLYINDKIKELHIIEGWTKNLADRNNKEV